MPWEKQFDRDEVLARAEKAFWTDGYQGTSLEMLLDKMGIQKGSFYATFGSKRETLLECIELYIRQRAKDFELLLKDKPPLEALVCHLDGMCRKSCGEGRDAGCFLSNIALELGPRDAEVRELIQKSMRGTEELYVRLLNAAKERGDLSADVDSTDTARALLGLQLGMSVMARASMPPGVIRSLRNQMLQLIGKNSKAAV